VAEIPIQRKERHSVWPWLLVGLLVLLAVLWFVFARGNAGNVAAARADSAAVANGAVRTDSAAGMTAPVVTDSAGVAAPTTPAPGTSPAQ
jgi:hypothetical protein